VPSEAEAETQVKNSLIWQEGFSGDLSAWNQNDFVESSDHRTGYKHLQLDGSHDPTMTWQVVPGRWAALMDKHRDKVQFIRDGMLVMRLHVEAQKNIYRKNFTSPDGKPQPYGDYIIYAPWLSMPRDNKAGWMKPGTITTFRCNLENMVMGGVRFSAWGMPVTGSAYDDDVKDVEIDIELENPQRYDKGWGQSVLMKILGGDAGDTPNALVNVLKKHNIDIRKGWHDFSIKWNHDGSLDFQVDKTTVVSDPRKVTVPCYLILSAEVSSGCKDPAIDNPQPHENITDGPYQPHNPGLTARSAISDIDLVDQHEVLIDSVRIESLPQS